MESLQFQKAEFAGAPQCDACKATIPDEYFKLQTLSLCATCASAVRAQQAPPGPAEFLRGLMFGAGMALACCIGYAAVIMISGLEIGLVAILVGYLVGRAVRQGARGRGGRRCQIAAVALTYLSITFSYIPVGIQQYRKQTAEKQKAEAVTEAAPPISLGSFVAGVAVLSGLAIVSPILNLQTGISGVLGLFILFLGLQRAWALTGRDPRELTGPFQRERTAEVG